MQLELALSQTPPSALMLWEQLDPVVRQTLIDRLALAIAKAAVPTQQTEESGDE